MERMVTWEKQIVIRFHLIVAYDTIKEFLGHFIRSLMPLSIEDSWGNRRLSFSLRSSLSHVFERVVVIAGERSDRVQGPRDQQKTIENHYNTMSMVFNGFLQYCCCSNAIDASIIN